MYVCLSCLTFGLVYILSTADLATNLSHSPAGKVDDIQTGSQTDQYQPIATLANPTLPRLTISTFAKVTASFGDFDPDYETAIASHAPHNKLHGYRQFILREQMVRGLWSKHSYLLTIIGQELAKPESQRLKWLFWHDRDTILMNPQVPLDIFLPPSPEFDHIQLLVTNDRNGLNNGVFMVRVGQWAFKMLASALSVREYQPELPLKYTEQSGMEAVIQRVRHSSNDQI